jgi:hypothetical protein
MLYDDIHVPARWPATTLERHSTASRHHAHASYPTAAAPHPVAGPPQPRPGLLLLLALPPLPPPVAPRSLGQRRAEAGVDGNSRTYRYLGYMYMVRALTRRSTRLAAATVITDCGSNERQDKTKHGDDTRQAGPGPTGAPPAAARVSSHNQ